MAKSEGAKSAGRRKERVLVGVFIALALGTSAVFWWVASPALGPIYETLRTIETAGLWRLTNWSEAFRSVPRGQPHPFASIYLSSIPFGLFFSVVIATIAALAWDKRRTRHLYVRITPAAGNLQPADLRTRFNRLLPHLAAPANTPPAEGGDDTAPNPFADLGDLRNPVQVRAAAESLPLPLVRALFLTLTAGQPGEEPLAGVKPADVEAAAWRSTRAGKSAAPKGDQAAQAALCAALTALVTRPAETAADDRRDAILQGEGTAAQMLHDLIAHTRATVPFPPMALGWLRWTMPGVASDLLAAGLPPITHVPENSNART